MTCMYGYVVRDSNEIYDHVAYSMFHSFDVENYLNLRKIDIQIDLFYKHSSAPQIPHRVEKRWYFSPGNHGNNLDYAAVR